MRDRIPLILLIIAILALIVIARAQTPEPAKLDLAAMKLDVERYRRIWHSSNAEYQGSLTQQQKDLISRLNAVNEELKPKIEALQKALNCEASKLIFNDDLLQCDPPPPPATAK